MNVLIDIFAARFHALNKRSIELIRSVPGDSIFRRPEIAGHPAGVPAFGELIIRSGAVIEQSFGGIMTRLWDDPFEWTLPEELCDAEKIVEYLNAVDATTTKGIGFFTSDSDLFRQIPAPDSLRPIAEILLDTIVRAADLQGRAQGLADRFPDILPRSDRSFFAL